METAKVFWSGRSQAVRLPRAYRVDGREVRIRRRGRAIVSRATSMTTSRPRHVSSPSLWSGPD
jgi:virulence-associated protein VagC